MIIRDRSNFFVICFQFLRAKGLYFYISYGFLMILSKTCRNWSLNSEKSDFSKNRVKIGKSEFFRILHIRFGYCYNLQYVYKVWSYKYIYLGRYTNINFVENSLYLAFSIRWFQTIANNFKSAGGMDLKICRKMWNRIISILSKFQNHSLYRKKVTDKKPGGGADSAPPPSRNRVKCSLAG